MKHGCNDEREAGELASDARSLGIFGSAVANDFYSRLPDLDVASRLRAIACRSRRHQSRQHAEALQEGGRQKEARTILGTQWEDWLAAECLSRSGAYNHLAYHRAYADLSADLIRALQRLSLRDAYGLASSRYDDVRQHVLGAIDEGALEVGGMLKYARSLRSYPQTQDEPNEPEHVADAGGSIHSKSHNATPSREDHLGERLPATTDVYKRALTIMQSKIESSRELLEILQMLAELDLSRLISVAIESNGWTPAQS